MKKFIQQIIKFGIFAGIGFLLLLTIIIVINRNLLDKCKLPDDTNAIIIGDSHTMWSIDDSGIKGLRNISLTAEGYIYTYTKLKHVIENEEGIKLIYLGVSYHNFSGYFDDFIYGGVFRYFIHRYLSVLTFRDYIKIILRNPMNLVELSTKVLQNGTNQIFNYTCELYGTFPEEKMYDKLDEEGAEKRIKQQYYRDGKLFEPSEMNISYLNKIIEYCNANNLRVIILNTPIHKDYLEMIPERYKSLYHDFINENNLTTYNFHDLNLPDSCFLPDADHVNYYGAMLTTEKFKEYHEHVMEK